MTSACAEARAPLLDAGYSSDAYIPQVSSHLLDSYPTSTGYQLFYTYVAIASFVGFLASWFLSRISKPRDDN